MSIGRDMLGAIHGFLRTGNTDITLLNSLMAPLSIPVSLPRLKRALSCVLEIPAIRWKFNVSAT